MTEILPGLLDPGRSSFAVASASGGLLADLIALGATSWYVADDLDGSTITDRVTGTRTASVVGGATLSNGVISLNGSNQYIDLDVADTPTQDKDGARTQLLVGSFTDTGIVLGTGSSAYRGHTLAFLSTTTLTAYYRSATVNNADTVGADTDAVVGVASVLGSGQIEAYCSLSGLSGSPPTTTADTPDYVTPRVGGGENGGVLYAAAAMGFVSVVLFDGVELSAVDLDAVTAAIIAATL